MIDRSLKRRFHLFLALAACLSLSFQTPGPDSRTEAAPGPLRCVDASLVAASALPAGTSGDGCMSGAYPSADPVWLETAPCGTVLSPQRRILPLARPSLAEGFPTELLRPPIVPV